MAHPNEEVIRQLFALYMSGDRQAAVNLFAEDAVFRYPGDCRLCREYRGRAEILTLWSEQDRLSGSEFRPELIDLVAGDRRVSLLVRAGDAAAGNQWMRVVIYEVADGSIIGAHIFEDNPAAAEAFFAAEGE